MHAEVDQDGTVGVKEWFRWFGQRRAEEVLVWCVCCRS